MGNFGLRLKTTYIFYNQKRDSIYDVKPVRCCSGHLGSSERLFSVHSRRVNKLYTYSEFKNLFNDLFFLGRL